jgi:hypothetical protein
MSRALFAGAAQPPAPAKSLLVLVLASILAHAAAQQGKTAYVITAVQHDHPENNTFKYMRTALESQQYDTILLTHGVQIYVSGICSSSSCNG